MSIVESIKIINKGDIALVELDLVGERVNKLSTPVMARFEEVLEELEKSSYKVAIIISRKPKIFIAGADIEEIKQLKPGDEMFKTVQNGQRIINRLEDLKIPTIAAIHGACMGGGCELALACDYRIASDDKSTRIGLPEVKLGLLPGFGGCVRLPKLVGLQASLDIILAGKAVNAFKAKRIGLIEQMVHPGILEQKAFEMANDLIKSGCKKAKKIFRPKSFQDKILSTIAGRMIVFSQAKKQVLKQSRGHYPAPLKALEVIRKTYGKSNRTESLKIEATGFCSVADTDVSRNLIHVFYLMEMVKKQTGVEGKDVKPRKIKSMGILGAGTMGGGIAFVAASSGVEVRMKDLNFNAIGKGLEAARKLWDKEVKKRRIDKYEMARNLAHLSGGLDFAGFKTLDLVVEAIVEDMEIKKKVIAETAKHCKEDCIIATNTSSLSVTEMAKGHPRPENFIGMHFFNPVDKMPLIEIICGNETSDEVVATLFDISKKMGKTPVVVKDGPGFLVNRLLLPWLSEALFCLEDGLDIKVVDRIFTHEFGMPMGPYHLIDEIGIDVCLKVLKVFNKALGERAALPDVAAKLLESGRLGRKGGKGFYVYEGRSKEIDPSIYNVLGLKEPVSGHDHREIIERGIYRMINEASLVLLEEKIVNSAAEVDLAMIMGAGFPPFRGGLLRYADSVGSQTIADDLEVLATKYGSRFKPTNPLINLAKTRRLFYSN